MFFVGGSLTQVYKKLRKKKKEEIIIYHQYDFQVFKILEVSMNNLVEVPLCFFRREDHVGL